MPQEQDQEEPFNQAYEDYLDRMQAETEARNLAYRTSQIAQGKVECHTCGYWVHPGSWHYPHGDPENGPAHKPE